MTANTFADRLRALRAAAALSQSELARRAGLPLPQYTRYERGDSEPRMTQLLRICAGLGVGPGAFDGCTIDARPPES